MSNNYWDDDEDDQDTDTNEQLDGSDLLKKLRKAKRSDEKRIKELTEQLEGLSKGQRERTVKEVLEKEGVNLKAAKYALNDLQDVTEESVKSWLNENADVFGYESAEEDPAKDENRRNLRRQDASSQGAKAPDREQDLMSRIDNAKNEDELRAILASQ